MTKPTLDDSVFALNLSVRAETCLEQTNIRTIRDLAETRPCDLLKLKNFGKKTLREIEEEMSKNGFLFGKSRLAKLSRITDGIKQLDDLYRRYERKRDLLVFEEFTRNPEELKRLFAKAVAEFLARKEQSDD